MAESNSEIIANVKAEIDSLPKPYSQEEQYLYALVCDLAGVKYKDGYLSNNVTFKSPFWRLQQYWHAFCSATALRLGLPVIPSADTVTTDALTEEVATKLLDSGRVTTAYIADKAVTEAKLADAVANKLLASGRITEDMLATALANKLLGSGRVTEDMLASAVAGKLLADGRVTKSMLSTDVQAILEKVK